MNLFYLVFRWYNRYHSFAWRRRCFVHQEMTPTSPFGALVRGRSPSKTLMFTTDWLSALVKNTWQKFKHHPTVGKHKPQLCTHSVNLKKPYHPWDERDILPTWMVDLYGEWGKFTRYTWILWELSILQWTNYALSLRGSTFFEALQSASSFWSDISSASVFFWFRRCIVFTTCSSVSNIHKFVMQPRIVLSCATGGHATRRTHPATNMTNVILLGGGGDGRRELPISAYFLKDYYWN